MGKVWFSSVVLAASRSETSGRKSEIRQTESNKKKTSPPVPANNPKDKVKVMSKVKVESKVKLSEAEG